MRMGNMNGETGFSGSLRSVPLTTDHDATDADGGAVYDVDATDGDVEITLPYDGIGPGWYAQLCLLSAGGNAARFVAGAGVTVETVAGATPEVVDQWATMSVRRQSLTRYIVSGEF